ncbi:hypothetical protein [Pseudodesulfovibrio sp. zrk46]|uniref:hypothetical protein n=1 Tax=Pseudodesulfovibrio sp. zrk46 TaxID=2725288 RepID=UPI0014492011|nr:hypothetical protein [Pseudodesulfovibrio sp. zrk46]QJB56402.1 hypothetical protein HFN16_08235 [Pseudodesulfovibrio sp. zrk46]
MKRIVALALLLLLFSVSAAMAGNGLPMSVAGITLGKDIKGYAKCCNMQLASPMPDAPFLSEVHLDGDYLPGVRGGSLTYGNCDNAGKVVRIKLKFHDRSMRLFDKLLAKYKKAYGNPDSYEGDAFKNVIAWRWNFSQDGQKVSVILMWSRVKELRPGVSIKMSLDSMIESEYECYRVQVDRLKAKKGGVTKIENLDEFVAK